MRWAKATLTFMYNLDDLEEEGWVTDDQHIIDLANEDLEYVSRHDIEWEIERFEG